MRTTRRFPNERSRHHEHRPHQFWCLPVGRFFSRLALEPCAGEKGIRRRIFSRQSQPWPLGVCIDLCRHQCVGWQFHGFPLTHLHARLGAGPLDCQLHGRADRRHGPARQTHESAGPPIRRRDHSGHDQGPVQIGRRRHDRHAADFIFHVLLPAGPIQGRQQNHDHTAAGRAHLPQHR